MHDDPSIGRNMARCIARQIDPGRVTFIAIVVIVAIAASAAPAAVGRFEPNRESDFGRPQTLVLDASFTHLLDAGPDPNHVGHRQLSSGFLRDSAGRTIGQFAVTCTWTRILASGDATERCAGLGRTADGRLDVAGAAHANEATHSWRLTGATGAYRGAHGAMLVQDISDHESLITATITPRPGVALRVAVVRRFAATAGFTDRADQICARASRRLAALPAFPFPTFDPLHPDPGLLPQVAAFFTGPGDPRPILRNLDASLRALTPPVKIHAELSRMLRARMAELAVINEQDNAALTGNARVFVDSVRDSTSAFRRVAITTALLGPTRCVL